MKPSPSRAVAPRTASSPGSPKATSTGAFLPSKVTSTAVTSRSKRRPSASEKGNREKAVEGEKKKTAAGPIRRLSRSVEEEFLSYVGEVLGDEERQRNAGLWINNLRANSRVATAEPAAVRIAVK